VRAGTDWRAHALGALRDRGYRAGGARSAVVDLLAEQDCCLTAQQIFDLLRSRSKRIGIASVYRALDVLAGEGLVLRLEIGDGAARFEPAHADGDHHHHAVCERCGVVQTFEDPALEQALDRLAGQLGLEVAGHDVVLRGSCSDCRAA
jgi:Fur family ferric uptake transcriptional regulator